MKKTLLSLACVCMLTLVGVLTVGKSLHSSFAKAGSKWDKAFAKAVKQESPIGK